VLIDEIVGWRAGLDDLLARFAHRFGRAEPRRQALTYMVGLLSPLASKNGWTLAEAAGDATPDRMQRLLNRSGDQDPSTWQPPLASYRCTYSKMWITVKYSWGLKLQSSEKSALQSMLNTCSS
jgi:hypothetical protein